MTKRLIMRFISAVILTVMILSLSLEAFALPINVDIGDNYFYTYYGEDVKAPVAYKPVQIIGFADLGIAAGFEPVDLFVRDKYLYVVDRGNNSIIILDENYQIVNNIKELTGEIPELNKSIIGENGELQIDKEMEKASKFQFNKPEGIFVTEDGLIYVADKENRRVVVCDIDGVVQNVYQSIRINVLGDSYIFKPTKLTVDKTGGMQIVAYAVNRGLMEIDSDGKFRSFLGAPPVQVNAIDWFWRLISTDEQKKRLVKYVPTEYNNIMVDDRGFIYATISTLDPMALLSTANAKDLGGSVSPIRKLSANGADVLRRQGVFPPIGDIFFTYDTSPQIVDVAIDNASGRYTLLDSRMGRFFTYDADGNLLYIGGGGGNQYGRFKSPYSITIRGEHIIISDIGNKTLTVFETTEYARVINKAVSANSAGKFDEAEEDWKNVINFNSNMYIAYVGLGKAELRKGLAKYDETRLDNYAQALTYFASANEKAYYSRSFKELQKDSLSKNFNLIAGSFLVLIIGIFVLYFVSKNRKKKKERGAK